MATVNLKDLKDRQITRLTRQFWHKFMHIIEIYTHHLLDLATVQSRRSFGLPKVKVLGR